MPRDKSEADISDRRISVSFPIHFGSNILGGAGGKAPREATPKGGASYFCNAVQIAVMYSCALGPQVGMK